MIRLIIAVLCYGMAAGSQELDPYVLAHPTADSWPTFNGDYSGKRFSALRQINRSNVGTLSMAWAFQTDVSTGPGLKSTPLLVNGTLYFTEPDDVWAVDTRSGRQNWHYHYHDNEGLHIGQRGLGMHKGRLYFETRMRISSASTREVEMCSGTWNSLTLSLATGQRWLRWSFGITCWLASPAISMISTGLSIPSIRRPENSSGAGMLCRNRANRDQKRGRQAATPYNTAAG